VVGGVVPMVSEIVVGVSGVPGPQAVKHSANTIIHTKIRLFIVNNTSEYEFTILFYHIYPYFQV
jgi:hypothetical protein